MSKCDVCDEDLSKIYLNLNVYSHFEFRQIYKKRKVYYEECNSCKLIYNKNFFKNNIFKSKSYILSNQTKQKKIKFYNKNINRAELQSKKFYKFISTKKSPSILDIGSFDGLLLKEIKKRINSKNYNLVGYDINKDLLKNYDKSIKFFTSLEKLFEFKYDLIILSHSIMYIDDLKKILSLIRNNLNFDGTLVIQFSNLDKRPMNLLLADQYIFPSDFSLNFIFNKYNLRSKKLTSEYFNNDNILIFNRKFNDKAIYNKNLSLKTLILENEKCFSNFLNKISFFKKFYVFGTTLEASIIHDLLLENNKVNVGFIDENITKKKFRNYTITDLDMINKKIKIIFPYNNINLKKRLEKKYKISLLSVY